MQWLEFMGVAELVNFIGGSNATYILEGFQDTIAQVITQYINLKSTSSPFITNLVDESKEITVQKISASMILVSNHEPNHNRWRKYLAQVVKRLRQNATLPRSLK